MLEDGLRGKFMWQKLCYLHQTGPNKKLLEFHSPTQKHSLYNFHTFIISLSRCMCEDYILFYYRMCLCQIILNIPSFLKINSHGVGIL